MAERQVKFSNSGGPVSIDVIIGQTYQGSYRVYVWDSNGQNPKMVGAGINWDDIADTVKLGTIAKIKNKIVTWEIMISVEKIQPGQFYTVNIIFRQDEKIVDSVSEAGPLNGTKSVAGAARIVTS